MKCFQAAFFFFDLASHSLDDGRRRASKQKHRRRKKGELEALSDLSTMVLAGRISRPLFLARRWAATAASAASDSPSSMMVAIARSETSTTSTSCSSLRTKHPFSSRSFASLPSFEEDAGQPTHETHPEVRGIRRGEE